MNLSGDRITEQVSGRVSVQHDAHPEETTSGEAMPAPSDSSPLDRLAPGDVRMGTISKITDFGAFVDLVDGIEGLIHISQLSWSHVTHPSELLELGQTVRVEVLDIDRDRGRISLGLKHTVADLFAIHRFRRAH